MGGERLITYRPWVCAGWQRLARRTRMEAADRVSYNILCWEEAQGVERSLLSTRPDSISRCCLCW